MTTGSDSGLKGRECKHAIYVTANDQSPNDLLVIKEYEHHLDGRVTPSLKMIQNYKRPFWITKEGFRNHNDKKEWDDINRLQKFESTQVNLVRSIFRALGRAPVKTDPRILNRSPYIYGTDVTTPVIAKQHYLEKWPDLQTDNRVALLDLETDVVEGHEEPIMGSITMKDKIMLVVVKSFFDGVPNPEQKIREAFTRYLTDVPGMGNVIEKRNLKLNIEFVKDAGEMSLRLIQTAHAWSPDILAIWNMNFDIPKMVKMLERYGYDLADAWSDPAVPARYKSFKYVEGRAQKVTASGKSMALHPAEQWHTAHTPASFYILDQMCVYLKLRIAKGKERSYALDSVLEKHLGIRKLKFEEASHAIGGLDWHRIMQREHKAAYCVYNIFDCISAEMLDEKTTDLSRMVSTMCGFSEYNRFPSQPRRTCDNLHFVCLEKKKVMATTSDQMETELDQLTVPLEGWITTLPSHLVHSDGLRCLAELPEVVTNIRIHVADLDIEGTYPNGQVLFNISRETTSRELCQIEGKGLEFQRGFGINLTGGFVNAVELVCEAYGAPNFDQMLLSFRETLPKSRAKPELARALNEESSKVTYIDAKDDGLQLTDESLDEDGFIAVPMTEFMDVMANLNLSH